MSYRGSTFAAGAARRDLAEVEVGADGVRARGLAGEATEAGELLVPWSDLRLEVGGALGGMAFCHHRGTGAIICCDDPAFLTALRSHGNLALREQLDGVARRAASGRRLRIGILSAVAVVLLLLAGGLWWLATAGVRRAVEALPPTLDRKLGDQAFASMDLGGTRVDPPAARAALETIVARLSGAAPRQDFEFRVAIVESDQINAFALPGGQIVVYTGLLAKAERAEQVAGVLAHEMAHVTLRHGLHGLARTAGIVIGFQVLFGDTSGLAGLAGQGAMSAVINGYSRTQEAEADAEGAAMLARAGIDARGLPEFFALLKSEPGSEATGIAAWFSDHPEHDERIAATTALTAKLQPEAPPAMGIDWMAVKASLGKP